MLEPEIRAFIERCDPLYPSGAVRLPFAEQRRVYDRFSAAFARPHPAGLVVRDGVVAGAAGPVRLRLYRPTDGGRGTLVYFHGGGRSRCSAPAMRGSAGHPHGIAPRILRARFRPLLSVVAVVNERGVNLCQF